MIVIEAATVLRHVGLVEPRMCPLGICFRVDSSPEKLPADLGQQTLFKCSRVKLRQWGHSSVVVFARET